MRPISQLRGIFTGDFGEAAGAQLGDDNPNLSSPVIAGLRDEGQADDTRWQRRNPSARRSTPITADSVSLQARTEPQAECMLT